MFPRRAIAALGLVGILVGVFLVGSLRGERYSNRWAKYEPEMQDPIADPADAEEKSEFNMGRLRYRSHRDGRMYARWGIDCNKSDRQFIVGLRRLTRVHARSIEEILDIENDDLNDWPWMFGVSIGDWYLTDTHARRLRDYFQRGGFMMVDDFHGESEWATFMAGMNQVFPEGVKVVELADKDPILQVAYDLSNRFPIPGANVVNGRGYERDGVTPHWRGIVDEKGRVLMAICFNMDVGDAWEFADSPEYPERIASLAFRLGVNYVLYALTH